MERQYHGFQYEDYCSDKYGVNLNSNYTDKWDGTYKGYPVSIKSISQGAEICMGDIVRQSQVNEDFYMFVAFHNDTKKIVEEHCLFIKGEQYSSLFNKSLITSYRTLLSEITNDKIDDNKWKKSIIDYRKQWESSTPNLIRPRPKRDHKKQKRIQCAISNADFYSYFIPQYEVGVN